MKVSVDRDTCIGCGVCPSICPSVFEMDGDRSSTKVDIVPEGDEDAAREGAESCPVEAIEID
ncbi:ferredoxin [bacterium]|nr:ferredoxin [bacterium]